MISLGRPAAELEECQKEVYIGISINLAPLGGPGGEQSPTRSWDNISIYIYIHMFIHIYIRHRACAPAPPPLVLVLFLFFGFFGF